MKNIGERLRQLRKERAMSQGDIEKATGIISCYVSRVEHGHIAPSLGMLERFAVALRVPLYRLFYEGDEPPPIPEGSGNSLRELAMKPGIEGAEARLFLKLTRLLAKAEPRDREIFMAVLQKLAANGNGR